MPLIPQQITDLENNLNNFDPSIRAGSLAELNSLAEKGEIEVAAPREVANMHCHSFFSFNAYGYSPTGLAWLAKKHGYKLMAIVDFDVLDGTEEFLRACDLVGVRGASEMETRVFFPEFSTRETNSPGEPGIYYHMGVGFTSSHTPVTASHLLDDMRERARHRNLRMIQTLNEYLSPVNIDYEKDVLPLTPAGNATERHMLVAYIHAAEKTVTNVDEFWAGKLKSTPEQIAQLRQNLPAFQNTVRSKLMKRGGVAYAQPGNDSFPSVEEFHSMVEGCGAIICATWLDGLSNGEQCMPEELEILTGKGAAALNLVPDRNWNVSDPELRKKKLQNLYDVVKLADQFDLPLNIGTEMNTPGNKLIDDFDTPELEPVRQAFIDGAYFVYGHTVIQRCLGLGYQSQWAKKSFTSRRDKNQFYIQIGRLVPPGQNGQTRLKTLPAGVTPAEIIQALR